MASFTNLWFWCFGFFYNLFSWLLLLNNWLLHNLWFWCFGFFYNLFSWLLLLFLCPPGLLWQLPLLTGHGPLPDIMYLTRNSQPVTSSLSCCIVRVSFSVSTRVKHSTGYFHLGAHPGRESLVEVNQAILA